MSEVQATVNIRKGRDGFEAKSSFKIEGVTPVCKKGNLDNGEPGFTRLDLSTGKASYGGGGLNTFASVGFQNEQGFFSFAIAQDFSKVVASKPGVRCTEKSVKALHEEALAKLPAILAAVKEFYAAKGLYKAPETATEGGAS